MPTPKISATTVAQIPLKQLLPDPDQPRKSFEKGPLQALADNIKQRGIQHPLLVRLGPKNQIYIKDGERRWRAAAIAKLKTAPVLLAGADKDTAQRRLDQVAINNLREELKPMELAKTLVRMRDEDKLSANEIAARLAKQGMTMPQAQIANMMKLVDLPAWAQDMVNGVVIEISAAREIAGVTDKTVLASLEKGMKQAANWRGSVTNGETSRCIREAYSDAGINLQHTNAWHDVPVLFDYKKACKGCPHLREVHGGAYCLDPVGFKKKQAEAKEAGLGPGGVRPKKDVAGPGEKKASPAQQKKVEEKKAELRAGALEDKTQYYLHNWARRRILAHLPTDQGDTAQRLVEFAAAHRPGVTDHVAAHVENKRYRLMRSVASREGYPTMVHFLKAEDGGGELYDALAMELVRQLPLIETLNVAHHLFGADIVPLWKVDAEYLDLLQKAELAQVAEKHATLPEGKKAWGGLKAGELKDAILTVADQVGVPPILAKLYAKPEVRKPDDLEDDEDLEGGGHGDDDPEGDE